MIGPQPRNPFRIALLRGLRELGYAYGEDFVTGPRGFGGWPERLPGLAVELVGLQVDVIVAAGPALPALKQATSKIPVVMTGSIDPVGQGCVRSLGRPGGKFTRLSFQVAETSGKRLELLKELVPSAAPVAVLWDRPSQLSWQATEAAARKQRWKLLSLELPGTGEIEGPFKAATDAGAGALLVYAAGHLLGRARRVSGLAAKSRLPATYELRPYVEAGGLMSYAQDLIEGWRRAAVFVDKILKGRKPADLPVEPPANFALVTNRKAARALSLTISQSVLSRAEAVIQ